MESRIKKKRAQEEIIGFAVIMVLVAVILLIFLWLDLTKAPADNVDDEQIKNFLLVLVAYNTECGKTGYTNLPLSDVVAMCADEERCLDGMNSCAYLKEELENVMDVSWTVGEDAPYTRYEVWATDNEEPIMKVFKGSNITSSYKENSVSLGSGLKIYLKIYE